MGSLSIWHILLVFAVVLVLFGAGKLPRLMGDFAKGIKSFRQEMRELHEEPDPPRQPGIISKDGF